MGTRGFVGFVSDELETITYNQYDSYPSGMGVDVLNFVRGMDEEFYRNKAANIRHVGDSTPPTRDEVVELIGHANLNVSTGSSEEWYVLLRETHGDAKKILDVGFAENAPEWPLDSLFCEWGYLIDFDSRTLDVYQGFQQRPPKTGRWKSDHPTHDNGYFPVRLVAAYSFDGLPTDEAFVQTLEKDDE